MSAIGFVVLEPDAVNIEVKISCFNLLAFLALFFSLRVRCGGVVASRSTLSLRVRAQWRITRDEVPGMHSFR